MRRLLALLLTLLLVLAWAVPCLAVARIGSGTLDLSAAWPGKGTVVFNGLAAATNLNVDSTTAQYSAYWTGNAANNNIGAVMYFSAITTAATSRVFTCTLQ